MSGLQLAFPKTLPQALQKINRRQEGFSAGMVSDIPASELPETAVAYIENAIAYEKYIEGRPGCEQFSSTDLPMIQVGLLINFTTIVNGQYKNYLHIGYSVLPGQYAVSSVPRHDQSELYYSNDSEQILSIGSDEGGNYFITARAINPSVSIRDQIFGCGYNNYGRYIIVHYGQSILIKYLQPDVNQTYQTMTFIGAVSDLPGRTPSKIMQSEKETLIFNGNGIYRLDDTHSSFFKANSICDQLPIIRNNSLSMLPYQRNYTYTMSIIGGDTPMFYDRENAGAILRQESSSVQPTLDDNVDCVQVGTLNPIGTSNIKYDSITGGIIHMIMADWVAITLGGFKIEIDGATRDITTDFSNCVSLLDVMTALTKAMRVYWPNAYCSLVTNGYGDPAIFITPGIQGSVFTLGYTQSPTAGTDISTLLNTATGSTNLIHNAATVLESQSLVRGLCTPRNGRQWTHYSIYASRDIGINGQVLGNLADLLVWVADVPVVKVWKVSTGVNIFTDISGNKGFSRFDEYSWGIKSDSGLAIALTNLFDSTGTNQSWNNNENIIGVGEGFSVDTNPAAFCIGAKKCGLANVDIHGLVVTITTGIYQFSNDDVGKLLFFSGGQIIPIAKVNSSSSITLAYTIGSTLSSIAIAWDNIVSTNRVLVLPTVGGSTNIIATSPTTFDEFVYDDVYPGEVIFPDYKNRQLFDGYNTNAGDASYTESGVANFNGGANIYFGMFPRSFNDVITDAILLNRIDSGSVNYFLNSRFFQPMASSPVATVTGDFAIVCQPGTASFDYCSIALQLKKQLGYHDIVNQVQTTINDVCTDVRTYNTNIVFFCRKGVWATDSASYNNVGEAALGQSIFVLGQTQQIDTVGVIHQGGIIDVAIGQSLVFASDGSQLIFNGTAFTGTNIAQNRIWKLLKAIYPVVSMFYDQNIGVVIYGSEQISAATNNQINPYTGVCYHVAAQPAQGSLWSKFSGEFMVWPEQNTTGILVDGPGGEIVTIVLDSRTGRWFIPFTYESYAGSSVQRTSYDKFNTDIAGQAIFPEHIGTLESFQIEHLVSHAYLRPRDESAGYLPNFTVAANIYANGSPVLSAATKLIPIDGDCVFDRKVMARRIQLQWLFGSTDWQLVCADCWYASRDTGGSVSVADSTSTETVYQDALAQTLVWLSRGSNLLLNRSNGIPASGAITPATGPDGQAGSAMSFNGSQSLMLANIPPIDGDFTIQFGLKLTP